MDLPWDKLDVVTWSWQKVLGGEAAHGMIALSPRAVARLESYKPAWPLPKIFQLSKGGKLIDGIFKGDTINTPSMLAVEDALDGLRWAEAIGGLPALIARSEANLAAIAAWVARTPWIEFLAESAAIRSPTSVCFKMADAKAAGGIPDLLAKQGVAYDIGAYRDAPPGLRIWAGATVETADLQALFPWLDWAWAELSK
jgi:phosphoserine aminotransferase